MRQSSEAAEEGSLLPRINPDGWLLELLLVVGRRKLGIFLTVFGAGVAALIAALLMPSIYEANTKILLPQQTPSIASAFAGSTLAGLAGGAKDISSALRNPADVYVSMLQSRTIADAIIDRFNLMNVYHSRRRMDCRKTLSGNVIITSEKGGVISITVDDRDPKRAADMANGFVAALSVVNQTLGVSEAAQRRLFFEQQLTSEREELAEAEAGLKHTQETSNFIAPESQTKALMEGVGKLRELISDKEVQLRTIGTFATDDNAVAVRLEEEIAALRAQLAQYERKGRDSDGMVPAGRLPEAGLDYLRRAREVKYHEAVMEILLRQFEAAKLDESRQATTIQVLDKALAPEFRVRPVRRLVVGVACLIAFFGAVLWVFLAEAMVRAKANPILSQKLDSVLACWLGKFSARFHQPDAGLVKQ
jgi:tyrosine-protein kinase Etk/Wzc